MVKTETINNDVTAISQIKLFVYSNLLYVNAKLLHSVSIA